MAVNKCAASRAVSVKARTTPGPFPKKKKSLGKYLSLLVNLLFSNLDEGKRESQASKQAADATFSLVPAGLKGD